MEVSVDGGKQWRRSIRAYLYSMSAYSGASCPYNGICNRQSRTGESGEDVPEAGKKGQKWHIHGYFALVGNVCLMAFYTVVTGWMIYYFWKFLTGDIERLGFVNMITNPAVNVGFLAITVAIGFFVLTFQLQGGLERVTKYMMMLLLALLLVLAVVSGMQPGAVEGYRFYLVPDLLNRCGYHCRGNESGIFYVVCGNGVHGDIRQLY